MRLSIGSFVLLVLAYATSLRTTESYTIHTVRGNLTGYRSTRFPAVVTFSGIPYAVQPTGNLRFRRTTALFQFPDNAGTTRDLGNACPQSSTTLGPDLEHYPQDEGCLYFQLAVPLTFFTTAAPDLHQALVTVHGGAFVSGSSGALLTDFRHPAALDGVASFSLNYRLGVLGFLTEPSATDHYSAGFYDQQLALAVIADVTTALGIHRTVLAGESAGATSVAAHLLATSTGYDAALLQSPLAGVRLTTRGETQTRWNQLLQSTGCHTLACLQSQATDRILQYQKHLLVTAELSLFDGHPDNFGLMPIGLVQDDVTFTDTLLVRQYNRGDGRHDIPVMVGTLQDEAFYKIYSVLPIPLPAAYYPLFSAYVVGPGNAAALMAQYPLVPADKGDIRQPIGRLVTDWAFGCAVSQYARESPANVYYYYYTHATTCSAWGPFCTKKSCHADDLALLYNISLPACPPLSAPEALLGMQWRRRIWDMLDRLEPWSHPATGGADGIEIGRADWSPVVFDHETHGCDFWERFETTSTLAPIAHGTQSVSPV